MKCDPAEHEEAGIGNDFWGWEFHKHTRVAYGALLLEETVPSYTLI